MSDKTFDIIILALVLLLVADRFGFLKIKKSASTETKPDNQPVNSDPIAAQLEKEGF